MAKEDPMEKISKLIEERINAAFEGRAQAEREEKDPWAKLEGLIDRTVAKHFQALNEGLEEGKASEGKKEEGDGPKLGILGF